VNRSRVEARGLRDGLCHLSAQHLPHNPFSPTRRQTGVLVHVHPSSVRIGSITYEKLTARPAVIAAQ
jgi:hypothetical protein